MTPVILIVEEQPALRKRYESFLREEGYQVHAMPPSEDALRLIREMSPDLIVIDPAAGAGRGMEIATEAMRIDPAVRLVFNTSDPTELELDFSSWLADAYTVRSPQPLEIGEAVRALLRRAIDEGPEMRVRHSLARARA